MEAQHNWPALLDELKCKESLSSDSKLAAVLGVTRGYICSVRKGRKGVSLELGEKILSRLGRTFEVETIGSLFVPLKVRRHAENIAETRRQVIARANGHCQLCGAEVSIKDSGDFPYFHLHHVIPPREGGSNEVGNLVALCEHCNCVVANPPDREIQERLEQLLKQSAGVCADRYRN